MSEREITEEEVEAAMTALFPHTSTRYIPGEHIRSVARKALRGGYVPPKPVPLREELARVLWDAWPENEEGSFDKETTKVIRWYSESADAALAWFRENAERVLKGGA